MQRCGLVILMLQSHMDISNYLCFTRTFVSDFALSPPELDFASVTY